MIQRDFWIDKIEKAWQQRSVIWLSGVRRVGKTFLCQSLPAVEYFDCELPRVRRTMDDPEAFLNGLKGLKNRRIVLDEVHRLQNPSELLKIGADHFPNIQILATGSSMLGASTKFKDTLTGRKVELWLTPMVYSDLNNFGNTDLNQRFLYGGLPPFFLSNEHPERDFQEWMDAYWAKDIQELFRLERRYSFQKFLELLMLQSGGIFEATKFSRPCEVSRTTISNYLKVLETTYVVNVLRPFNSRRSTEIVSAPKVYVFDTGFACYYRGWHTLRNEDMGLLWEHFVLNELHAHLQSRNIYYWRNKHGHEIDLIIAPRGQAPIAVECKWSTSDFDAANLKSFRRLYPTGDNYVVANDIDQPFSRKFGDLTVRFVGLQSLIYAVVSDLKTWI